MSPEAVLQLAVTALGSVGLGLLVWALRRNIQSLDRDIGEIKTDVRSISQQTTQHGAALAGGVVKFQAIEKRLDGLEDRERVREKECMECQRLRIEGARG